MRNNNYITILAFLVGGFFVVSLYVLMIQAFDATNAIKATIISGVLSMFGGQL